MARISSASIKGKLKRKSQRELSAYHEAGHVVLSVACDWPVHGCTIKKREVTEDELKQGGASVRNGYKIISHGFTDVRYGGGKLDSMRDDKLKFLRWSMSALAGAVAEGVWVGEKVTNSQDIDLAEYR